MKTTKEVRKFEGNHGIGCLLILVFWPLAIWYYIVKTKKVTTEVDE